MTGVVEPPAGDRLPVTVVPASLDGERVDRVVATLTGLTRGEVARMVERGDVRLDGVPVPSRHRRVLTGEQLEILLPDASVTAAEVLRAEPVEYRVVHEDAAIVVIDKPAGLVVHPGAGHAAGTLAAGLLDRYADIAAAASSGALDPLRPGIVHRLDKDTSGLLVVARTKEAQASLVAQLASRTMGRRYRALALGRIGPDEGVIEAPVGRSERDPTRMAVTVRGRAARTRYSVVARYDLPTPASLLEVELDTGRTHQIRVHLSAIGHPILGDPRYGGRRRGVDAGRPFLHAEHLGLLHPTTGRRCEFDSPLPPDLVELLASFS